MAEHREGLSEPFGSWWGMSVQINGLAGDVPHGALVPVTLGRSSVVPSGLCQQGVAALVEQGSGDARPREVGKRRGPAVSSS